LVWKERKYDRTRGEGIKRNHQFLDPAYIHQLTDEYRRARTVGLVPLIFVGDATSLMNVGGLIDEYMGLIKVKSDDPYICWCPIKTNEYKFIFINFRTDEYNLNIFIDKFKNSDK
jgi:hypothetical protein